LATYTAALRAGFIWNDSDYLTDPELQSFSGLWRIWFEVGATEQYYPLLHSWFWLQHRFWGDLPLGYHLVNILLHAGNAIVLWAVLRRLAIRGALLAAFLFALHPVCVESVAWISEQKNTLSTLLYLLAALCYLRFDEQRRPRDYLIASIFFVLALFAKSLTATLAGALLVVFWWQRGQLAWRRDILPLLPWFVLGATLGLFTGWVERSVLRAQGADFAFTFPDRLLIAGRAMWFYLGKIFWPADLIFIYPRWQIDASTASWTWLFPITLLALLAGLWRLRTASRAPLAALLIFLGSAFPTAGFLNIYGFRFSFVADHWQYLPCIAILTLAAAGLTLVGRQLAPALRWAPPVALLALLSLLSWRQGGLYRDIVTFYEKTLAANPACWMAHSNLGIISAEAGDWSKAIFHYETGLRLKPDSFELNHNLGTAFVAAQRWQEAVDRFEKAIQLEPRSYASYNSIGTILRNAGQNREAEAFYRRALAAKPNYVAAQKNLGLTLIDLGRHTEAIKVFEDALGVAPTDPETHNNLGVAFTDTRRFPEAEAAYRRAITLDPGYAAPHDNYGNLLRATGRLNEAIAEYEKAIALNANSPVTLVNLTIALTDANRCAEAVVVGERAVALAPHIAEAHFNLALALQCSGRRAEAIAHYELARRQKPALPVVPTLLPTE
jgi:tetratricopeptide (TPR) repeat protein